MRQHIHRRKPSRLPLPPMSWLRATARVLVLVVSSGASLHGSPAPAGPPSQGIPGTRAHFEGRSGWDAIREGRHQDAADAFGRAINAEPRDPSLHLGAGLAAYLLGRPTVAQQSLQRALAMAPSLMAASLLLADILYRGSDIAGAIEVYESALQYAPADTTLNARLEAIRREAALHNDFFASYGAHFMVLFDSSSTV